jgi:hypothetical protein
MADDNPEAATRSAKIIYKRIEELVFFRIAAAWASGLSNISGSNYAAG